MAQHRQLGDHVGLALCLSKLATTYLTLNNYDMARTHLLEALAISEREGEVLTRPFVLGNLSEVSMKTGDLPSARQRRACPGLAGAV